MSTSTADLQAERQQAASSSRVVTQYTMTYADLDDLPDYIERCELWEGEFIVSPSPTASHQMISFRLTLKFGNHDPNLEHGFTFAAPLDVVLREDLMLQPDLIWVAKVRREIIEADGVVKGAPDVCLEIVSPRPLDYDSTLKRNFYAEGGVREYWLVDPFAKTVTVYDLAGDAKTEYAVGQTAASTLAELDGLQVPVEALFAAF